MPYTLNRRPNHTVEIAADLSPDEVDRERQAILRHLQRSARVPGFRAGKAPLSVIRGRYAGEVDGELRERLAEKIWQEVVEGEDDLKPITTPRISTAEVEDDGSFRFAGELEVRPELELADFDSLSLPEVSLEVAETEIEEELAKLQEENATWEPADDEPAADGILVEAAMRGEYTDGEGELFNEDPARFVLGSEGLFPEINEAVQGATVGAELTAEKRFPDDDPDTTRAGRVVRFFIDVKGLKRKVLPEVDDELAKTLGLESAEELKSRIQDSLRDRKRVDRRSTWRRALLDQLTDGFDLNSLPSSLVQGAINEEMQRFAYAMAMQGVDPAQSDVDWQEMSAKFEPQARRKVLDTLALEHLAGEWGVKVPEAEVDAYVRSEAQRLGIPPAEHKANLAKEHRLEGVRHGALMAATVDELIRHAGGEVE
jgi:trigger factor